MVCIEVACDREDYCVTTPFNYVEQWPTYGVT